MSTKYKRLGKHGLLVSNICLGTMNFGWHTPEEESFRVMDRALELGVNFFEIGWPLRLKLSQTMSSKLPGILIASISIILSGMLLWMVPKIIPTGAAYAVWTRTL
jgi:hypothetical protein